MADRLAVYRAAQRHIGTGRIASLTEVNEARFAFDDVWAESVDRMLAEGMWNFAIRAIELSYDADFEPLFGYQYSFSQPDDYVRIVNMSTTGEYLGDHEDYDDERGYWFSDINPLYIRYVSSGTSYGWNVGAWTQPFADALAALMAFKCALPIANDRGNRNDMFQIHEKLLLRAKTIDAVEDGVKRKPPGRLVQSRFRRSSVSRERA
jgi:hypothetical protein